MLRITHPLRPRHAALAAALLTPGDPALAAAVTYDTRVLSANKPPAPNRA